MVKRKMAKNVVKKVRKLPPVSLLKAFERIRRDVPARYAKRREANDLQRRIADVATAAHYQREYNSIYTRTHALHPGAEAAQVKLTAARQFQAIHPSKYLPRDVT